MIKYRYFILYTFNTYINIKNFFCFLYFMGIFLNYIHKNFLMELFFQHIYNKRFFSLCTFIFVFNLILIIWPCFSFCFIRKKNEGKFTNAYSALHSDRGILLKKKQLNKGNSTNEYSAMYIHPSIIYKKPMNEGNVSNAYSVLC